MGPKVVVISSSDVGGDPKFTHLYASRRTQENSVMVKIEIPILKRGDGSSIFTGTGDLLTSMLVAQTEKHVDNFPKAI
jgi:pyridoxal/pyridoxine/pyridoxamine kinase